jgi:TRAP-type mannitol/chloroaromatic compound transport system permease small subunit
VAVAICATRAQVALNLLLTLLLLVPGVIHALWIVYHHNAAGRHRSPILGKPNPFGLG